MSASRSLSPSPPPKVKGTRRSKLLDVLGLTPGTSERVSVIRPVLKAYFNDLGSNRANDQPDSREKESSAEKGHGSGNGHHGRHSRHCRRRHHHRRDRSENVDRSGNDLQEEAGTALFETGSTHADHSGALKTRQ